MANTRDIRNRIKSVKNTAKITRAMQLVAASKMKRAQESAIEGRRYARKLAGVIARLTSRVEKVSHPALESREINKRGVLLLTTDRGLCGPLNSNLFREAADIKGDVRWYNVGRKGRQFLSRSGRDLAADFHVTDKAAFTEVRPIVKMLIDDFLAGTIDTIEVLYPAFVNTLMQEPRLVPLVPIFNLQRFIAANADQYGDQPDDERDFIFEPDPRAVLDQLILLFIRKTIYQVILAAKASEHSARMVAMKAATDNANNLVGDLTLEYNKARQAAITQEILEISAATFFN